MNFKEIVNHISSVLNGFRIPVTISVELIGKNESRIATLPGMGSEFHSGVCRDMCEYLERQQNKDIVIKLEAYPKDDSKTLVFCLEIKGEEIRHHISEKQNEINLPIYALE